MANKQQTALQTLIKWGDKMLKENPNKILSFSEVIDKAEELLQMEREHIEQAFIKGNEFVPKWKINGVPYIESEQYYEQTYGK
jgi:hypothetical protein